MNCKQLSNEINASLSKLLSFGKRLFNRDISPADTLDDESIAMLRRVWAAYVASGSFEGAIHEVSGAVSPAGSGVSNRAPIAMQHDARADSIASLASSVAQRDSALFWATYAQEIQRINSEMARSTLDYFGWEYSDRYALAPGASIGLLSSMDVSVPN